MIDSYLPSRVNQGPWVTAYTLPALAEREHARWTLPVCSLATPYEDLERGQDGLLPPLFREAMDESLQGRIVERIRQCFPCHQRAADTSREEPRPAHTLEVVELPASPLPASGGSPEVIAFSVDTAVEEHGPHLPLATDTIQSYGVLRRLAHEIEGLELGRPLEYGQLTWGLPFGFSVDLTAGLLSEYVANYARAIHAWRRPGALYVVDVHGSIVHRRAIVEGLRRSGVPRWAFRWLHEPLAEFASERGDQHAGGVETALVEWIEPALLDETWWPDRIEELAAKQMSFEEAVRLTPDLEKFTRQVEQRQYNGIVGDILNYRRLDASRMMSRMLDLARSDVDALLRGETPPQGAGDNLW